MANEQLYLAMGVPAAVNAALLAILFADINARDNGLESASNRSWMRSTSASTTSGISGAPNSGASKRCWTQAETPGGEPVTRLPQFPALRPHAARFPLAQLRIQRKVYLVSSRARIGSREKLVFHRPRA